jgi:hypothetical protein
MPVDRIPFLVQLLQLAAEEVQEIRMQQRLADPVEQVAVLVLILPEQQELLDKDLLEETD